MMCGSQSLEASWVKKQLELAEGIRVAKSFSKNMQRHLLNPEDQPVYWKNEIKKATTASKEKISGELDQWYLESTQGQNCETPTSQSRLSTLNFSSLLWKYQNIQRPLKGHTLEVDEIGTRKEKEL